MDIIFCVVSKINMFSAVSSVSVLDFWSQINAFNVHWTDKYYKYLNLKSSLPFIKYAFIFDFINFELKWIDTSINQDHTVSIIWMQIQQIHFKL